MTKFQTMMCVAAVFVLGLVLVAAPVVPQGTTLTSTPASEEPNKKAHRLVIQVNTADPPTMNVALNNAANVEQYYRDLGESIEIEIVAFGAGLHMLRSDTSPVKDRLKDFAERMPSIAFKACGNTQEKMRKAENKPVPLMPQATLVKSGVVRIMELQEQGWSYVRP